MEQYGFSITCTGDAAQKLKDLGVQFQQIETQAKNTTSTMGNFSTIFGGMTLGGIASQGLTAAWSGVKDEIMESEKATIDFEKAQRMLAFSFQDTSKTAIDSMDNLAKSSAIFSPTLLMEAETQLHRVGDLTTEQIQHLSPMIQDFATVSGQDISQASMLMASAMETGMIRNKELRAAIAGLHLELKKGDVMGNYNVMLQALGKYSGGAAAYTQTLAGQLDVLHTKIEKI